MTTFKTLSATDASVYRILPTKVARQKTNQDIVTLVRFAENINFSHSKNCRYLIGRTNSGKRYCCGCFKIFH
jgi:hypothetical protein